MEFISVEEFVKQPKEVQEIFMEWWQPSEGDLYCNLYNGQQDNVLVINNVQLEIFKSFSDDIKKYGIPLLTEGQLRRFIEDKGYRTYIKTYELPNDYGIFVFPKDCLNSSRAFYKDNLETNILKAYWKVACEIAKENLEDEN